MKEKKRKQVNNGYEEEWIPGLCAFAVKGICGVDGEKLKNRTAKCHKQRKRKDETDEPHQFDWIGHG
jgi:hypothetical protein